MQNHWNFYQGLLIEHQILANRRPDVFGAQAFHSVEMLSNFCGSPSVAHFLQLHVSGIEMERDLSTMRLFKEQAVHNAMSVYFQASVSLQKKGHDVSPVDTERLERELELVFVSYHLEIIRHRKCNPSAFLSTDLDIAAKLNVYQNTRDWLKNAVNEHAAWKKITAIAGHVMEMERGDGEGVGLAKLRSRFHTSNKELLEQRSRFFMGNLFAAVEDAAASLANLRAFARNPRRWRITVDAVQRVGPKVVTVQTDPRAALKYVIVAKAVWRLIQISESEFSKALSATYSRCFLENFAAVRKYGHPSKRAKLTPKQREASANTAESEPVKEPGTLTAEVAGIPTAVQPDQVVSVDTQRAAEEIASIQQEFMMQISTPMEEAGMAKLTPKQGEASANTAESESDIAEFMIQISTQETVKSTGYPVTKTVDRKAPIEDRHSVDQPNLPDNDWSEDDSSEPSFHSSRASVSSDEKPAARASSKTSVPVDHCKSDVSSGNRDEGISIKPADTDDGSVQPSEDDSVQVIEAPGKGGSDDDSVQVIEAPGKGDSEDDSVQVIEATGRGDSEDDSVQVMEAPDEGDTDGNGDEDTSPGVGTVSNVTTSSTKGYSGGEDERFALEVAKTKAAIARTRSLLGSLDAHQEERLNTALTPGGKPERIVSKAIEDSTDTVSHESFLRFLPGEWLNDELIHFYIGMLNRNEHELYRKDNSRRSCYCFKSFFFTKIFNDGHSDPRKDGTYEYKNVKRWSKHVPGKDIFELDKLLFVINLSTVHWLSAAAFMQQKRIQVYDSYGTTLSTGEHWLNCIFRYLKDEHRAKKHRNLPNETEWELIGTTIDTPRQRNGVDCGVFATMIVDYHCKDHPLVFSQEHIHHCRKKIALSILTGKLIP